MLEFRCAMETYRSGHNERDSKSCCHASGTWVRIPPSPPQEQPYPNSKDTVAFIYFCYNGVAGIIIPTQIIEQRRSLHWEKLKRNKGTWTI